MASLSQLIALPDLGLRLVQSGPGDPELSWASTTELLDLGEYLEGGEVVLTTGLALNETDTRWLDFVAGLSRARIAAIGFGVGVSHERIPPRLIAAASTYRVSLFEVPPPVPFIAVSKAVAGLLHADELRGAQRALQIHQRLLDGSRGSQNTAEVLASIAQATGRQLAVVAADDSPIASTAGFVASRSGGDDLSSRDTGGHESVDIAAGVRLVVAGGAPLGPEERAVVAAGAMVLGLGLRGERDEVGRERGRWARLASEILRGALGADALRLLDPDLEMPDRVRAIAVQGAAEDLAAWWRSPRSGFDRLVTAGEPGSPGIALAWQLVEDEAEAITRVLTGIRAHGLDAVVGRAAGADSAIRSLRSALARIDTLSSNAQLYAEPREPVVIQAERMAPILENLLGGTEHSALAHEVLGPLSDGERNGREQGLPPDERRILRETLRALFTHNDQRGPTAAELGIHRNTLRDRVRRIERCTGRSLDHPDDRAELWLAIRLEEGGS